MPTYQVEVELLVPEFKSRMYEADTEEDAAEQALEDAAYDYPEAIEIKLIKTEYRGTVSTI